MRSQRVRNRPNAIFFLLRLLGGESGDWALLGWGFAAGALAFLWAGYVNNPNLSNLPQKEPWSLFGLFCLIIMLLEASILLDPSLPEKWKPSRAKVVTTLAVTAVCIVGVTLAYLLTWPRIGSWLHQLLPELASLGAWIGANRQVVFILANVACLAILGLGVRFATYDPESEAAADANDAGDAAQPRARYRHERLAGDLALITCFSFLLAWVFFAPFWQTNSALAATALPHGRVQTGAPQIYCDLSYLPYSTPCTLQPFDVSTIFFLDLVIIPGLCGLAILYLLWLEASHESLERGDPGAFPSVFVEVFLEVIRRRLTLPNLLLALRFVWPLALLLATTLAGFAARASEQYLYNVGLASHGSVLSWVAFQPINLGLEFGAAAALIVAVSAAVAATTLQIFPRVWERSSLRRELAFSWRHVRFLALMFAVSYWVFSLIFSIINGLALVGVREWEIVARHTLPASYHWASFVQPDPLMLLSLAIFATVLIQRTGRRRRTLALERAAA